MGKQQTATIRKLLPFLGRSKPVLIFSLLLAAV